MHGISLSHIPVLISHPFFPSIDQWSTENWKKKAEGTLSTTSSHNFLALSILIRSDSAVKRASILQAFSVLVRETAGYIPRFREVNPHLC